MEGGEGRVGTGEGRREGGRGGMGDGEGRGGEGRSTWSSPPRDKLWIRPCFTDDRISADTTQM